MINFLIEKYKQFRCDHYYELVKDIEFTQVSPRRLIATQHHLLTISCLKCDKPLRIVYDTLVIYGPLKSHLIDKYGENWEEIIKEKEGNLINEKKFYNIKKC